MDEQETRNRDLLKLDIPDEGHQNYSIVAGAGGGKTTMLSDRISRQIALGTPIEEFVIITYTNAAANELRDKIADKLAGLLKQDPDNTVITEALSNVELMQISTIHSFLLKILREYAFESHVALGAQMLEDEDDVNRKKAFFAEWRRSHFREMNKLFRRDWITKNGYRYNHDVLERTFLQIADIREPIVMSDHPTEEEIMTSAHACVDTLLDPLIRLSEQITATKAQYRPMNKSGKGEKKLLKNTFAFIDAMDQLRNLDRTDDRQVLNAAVEMGGWLIFVQERRHGEKTYYYRSDPDPMFDEVLRAEDHVLDLFDPSALYMDLKNVYEAFKAKKVIRYLQPVQQAYQSAAAEQTTELNNDDILFRSEQFLLQHPEVLDRLRKRYSKIYVDEFQDTTGLQTRIVKMLSEEPGTRPEEEILSGDKLVVVGDPKQSIYRFTGAEIAVYDDVNEMMVRTAGCERIQLNYNFRSNKAVIDWVNEVYTGLMDIYEPMKTEWEIRDDRALHGVYQYPKNGDARSDAELTVALIRNLVESPWYFIEERGGKRRRIRYSDFMVITKSTTHMPQYADEFYANGIPVNISGRISVDKDEVLHAFIKLVTYFANPKNEQNRYVSEQVLSGLDISRAAEDEISEASEKLQALREKFAEEHFSMAAIVQYLLNHEEYYVPKNAEYTRQRVREYRIHLHQMVETVLESDVQDLGELAQAMEEYRVSKVERDLPLESDENAVRLMNVHKSKGLTANIVIIADRSKKEEPSYSGFRKGGYYYPSVVYKLMEEGSVTNVPTYLCDEEIYTSAGEDEMAEAVRLQYVAATRAAQALIFMPEIRKEVWFSDPGYHLEELPDILEWMTLREQEGVTVAEEETETKKGILTLQNLRTHVSAMPLADMQKADTLTVSPSQLEGDGITGFTPDDAGYRKEDRPAGKGLGLVMHKAFELLVKRSSVSAGKDRDLFVSHILNESVMCVRNEMPGSDDPKVIIAWLKPILARYMDTVIGPILADASEVYPEYTFSFCAEGEELKRFTELFKEYFLRYGIDVNSALSCIRVSGTSDLVVRRKDGSVWIYDYKSDGRYGMPADIFEKRMAEKYEGQLKLYRYAVSKAFGTDDIHVQLIHLYK